MGGRDLTRSYLILREFTSFNTRVFRCCGSVRIAKKTLGTSHLRAALCKTQFDMLLKTEHGTAIKRARSSRRDAPHKEHKRNATSDFHVFMFVITRSGLAVTSNFSSNAKNMGLPSAHFVYEDCDRKKTAQHNKSIQ